MSIAEKLTMVAENEQKVYDAGKKSEYDKFWDACQNYGNKTMYQNGFMGATFNKNNFYPKYDIHVVGKANQMFYAWSQESIPDQMDFDLAERLRECNVTLDTSQATQLNLAFSYSFFSKLPVINATGLSSLNTTFSPMYRLVTIEKIIVDESVGFANTFDNCPMLQNITIEGVIGKNGLNLQWSTSLTHDSLMSIINCLQDKTSDTSGTSWKITIGATNIAKLTTEELAIAKNKGWAVE